MSDLDLDAIEARAKAATPGPWPRDFGRCDFSPEGCMSIGPLVTMDDECDEERQAQADQDFIAAARTDVPALVAEVRRLTKGHEVLNAALGSTSDDVVSLQERLQRVVDGNKALRAELAEAREEVTCWKGREAAYRSGYLELHRLATAWLTAADAYATGHRLPTDSKERSMILWAYVEGREAVRRYLAGGQGGDGDV